MLLSPIRSDPRSPRTALRRRRPARSLLVALAAAFLLGTTGGSAAALGIPARLRATQQLAVMVAGHVVHLAPEAGSRRVAALAARRPITGEQTTLPVIGSLTGPDGVRWLRVMLPGRPNGSTGWITERGTRKLVTAWHLVIDLTGRHVRAYREGRLVRAFRAVVGKPSTPTPTGEYFVEEALQMSTGEAGGPFALALSARSNALQEFEGGPGQIAIHGRDNLGGVLGTAESHGCVRLDTGSIDWLAARIGPGTPVTIY